MSKLQRAKSGVLLMFMLPFLLIVVASPFTHTCIEFQPVRSASSTMHAPRGHNADVFIATAVAPPDGDESCAACVWALSASTFSQPIFTLCSAVLVACCIDCKLEPRASDICRLNTPRAPPPS